METDTSVGCRRTGAARERALAPQQHVCHFGTEFAAQALGRQARRQCIPLLLIQPGRPVKVAFIESLSGRLHIEGLEAPGPRYSSKPKSRAWRVDSDAVPPLGVLANHLLSELAHDIRSSRSPTSGRT